MQLKLDKIAGKSGEQVYVRKVDTHEIPTDVFQTPQEQTGIYAIHAQDGRRLTLVSGRSVAFEVARSNELVPLSVH